MKLSETTATRRGTVRLFAAATALLTSVMYFLIGFQVLTVLDNPDDQTSFGMIAGGAFLIGFLVILLTDNRFVMALGAAAQAMIIFLYFSLAADREPSFETWGILIRVLQVVLFGALVYLAFQPKTEHSVDVEPTTPDVVDAGSGARGAK